MIQVQGLTFGVHRQGVDPGNALQLLHRVLQGLQAVSLVHAVPLLQYPRVVQIGIAQAEGVLPVPVQAPGPLYHRAKHRTVDIAADGLELAVLVLDCHGKTLVAHRHRLAVEQVAGWILGIKFKPVQGEVLGGIHRMGPGQVTVEADIDQWQPRQCGAHDVQLAGHG
ncbi:hypothetical protein D3C77_510090 [compost metagenome]